MRKIILLLLLATLIAFGTSSGNGFVLDDLRLIVNNPLIKNLKFLPQLFSRPFLDNYYRPLTLISLALDYSLWQLNPCGYHLTNVLLHAFNAILFFILLNSILPNRNLAALTSILFAIHPLNSVTVNFISDRGNLLVASLMLLALISFSLGYKKQGIQYYLCGFLFFILALFSRENAILLPLYLLCIFGIIYQKGNLKQIIILSILTSLFSLGYLLLRLRYFSLASAICPDFKLLFTRQSLTSFAYLIFKYLSLTIYPYNICLVRRIEPQISSEYTGIFYLLLLILTVTFFFLKFRKDKLLIFAFSWFLVGVLPLYNLMFFRLVLGLIMQDNWIYCSLPGLLLIFSLILLWCKRRINQKLWYCFVFFVCLFYANISIANNALWRTAETYGLYWLRLSPRNYLAHSLLAGSYARDQDYDRAKDYYQKAIELNPHFADGYYNLGGICFDLGKYREAIPSYKKAIELNPDLATAHNNLANVYYKLADYDQAQTLYKKAIELNRYSVRPYYNLGIIYHEMHNHEQAQVLYKKAIAMDPYFADAYYNLGNVYYDLGDYEQAAPLYEQTISFNPKHAQAYYNLALIYFHNKQYKLAIQYSDRAQELGFVNPSFLAILKPHRNLAKDAQHSRD